MSDNHLEDLLELQARDTRLEQLRHRRESLPERAQLLQLERRIVGLSAESATLEGERDELRRRQGRLEDEVAAIEAKVAEVNATLYGGSVSSPRELQALQEEIEALGRRQRQLEDEVIEYMEGQEPLTAELDRLAAERGATEAEVESVRQAITAQEAEIDVDIDSVRAERVALADGLADGLIERYERLRGQLGGVAVARLDHGRCTGCNLLLSAVERDRIRGLAPDEEVQCEECDRLLVH